MWRLFLDAVRILMRTTLIFIFSLMTGFEKRLGLSPLNGTLERAYKGGLRPNLSQIHKDKINISVP